MLVHFHGKQSIEQAAESLMSILKLFQERYGIENYREILLNITFTDEQGHDIELIDAKTAEVLGKFEVYQSITKSASSPKIRLVVDNTKAQNTRDEKN